MADERELQNRVERVPAAPNQLFVLRTYNVQPGSEEGFGSLWRDFAAKMIQQPGCLFLRLHCDLERPARFLTYELWQSRLALIGAIRRSGDQPAYPLVGHVHEDFVRHSKGVAGSERDLHSALPGQIVTVRRFYLKVNTEPIFERLWAQSAQAEARRTGSLYKHLHRDLNLPTHYVSYSLWADRAAPEEAAHDHAHWQAEHEPYPLASPVVRETLEVRAQIRPQ
jgi:quinol monooxygenase YgiN